MSDDKTYRLISGIDDFRTAAASTIRSAKQDLCLLCHDLPPLLWGDTEIISAISELARRSRFSRIRILVRDPNSLTRSHHPLLQLLQRLSSKIECRKLMGEQQDQNRNYMVGDSDKVFCQHEHHEYQGFLDTYDPVQAQNLLEEFNLLWERHSSDIPDLRQLGL